MISHYSSPSFSGRFLVHFHLLLFHQFHLLLKYVRNTYPTVKGKVVEGRMETGEWDCWVQLGPVSICGLLAHPACGLFIFLGACVVGFYEFAVPWLLGL